MKKEMYNLSRWMMCLGIILLSLSACHKDKGAETDPLLGKFNAEIYRAYMGGDGNLEGSTINEWFCCSIDKQSDNVYIVSWYPYDSNCSGSPQVVSATYSNGHLVYNDANMNLFSFDLVLEETKENTLYGMCMDYSTISSQAGGECRFAHTFKLRLTRQ